MTVKKQSLSYKDAGVDIDAGNALIEKIKGAAMRTRRSEVMAGLGGLGLFLSYPWVIKSQFLCLALMV